MPHISSAYLINARKLKLVRDHESLTHTHELPKWLSFKRNDLDPDMAFTTNVRDSGHFMYVSNEHDYGHLASDEGFVTENRTHPDLYELFNNRLDWQRRYVHENWSKVLEPEAPVEQPCPDVYWFPVVTETFCKHLIDTMEHFGRWSDGSNKDERLAGGYENVPTRDIHMNQVGVWR